MNPLSQLDIVIITYNRPDDALALAQNISELEHLYLIREIIFVNNRSTLSYEKLENFIEAHPHLPFRYYKTEENLGVSRGRNYAIGQSSAPLLVFLDDDAVFQNKDALLQIVNIFEEEEQPQRITGIAAFKVYYYATGELQQTAFPHKQFDRRKDWPHFQTAYFAGCAHAIRRTVLDTVGLYPENFFYGMEEYDLSYRALNAGFKIVYDNRVVVLHKESPEGRLPNKEKLRGMWVNKTKVAWKYLPLRYVITTAFLWSLEYLKKTHMDMAGWIKGWRQVVRIPKEEKRKVVNKDCLDYLKKVQARLWY